jgi:hypothetical protein
MGQRQVVKMTDESRCSECTSPGPPACSTFRSHDDGNQLDEVDDRRVGMQIARARELLSGSSTPMLGSALNTSLARLHPAAGSMRF